MGEGFGESAGEARPCVLDGLLGHLEVDDGVAVQIHTTRNNVGDDQDLDLGGERNYRNARRNNINVQKYNGTHGNRTTTGHKRRRRDRYLNIKENCMENSGKSEKKAGIATLLIQGNLPIN